MKKKLYYTIEKEIATDNETLTGIKIITVYEILNNVPTRFITCEGSIEDKSTTLIQDYLDDNGYGDDEFEFIFL